MSAVATQDAAVQLWRQRFTNDASAALLQGKTAATPDGSVSLPFGKSYDTADAVVQLSGGFPSGAPFYSPSSFYNRPINIGGSDSYAADQTAAFGLDWSIRTGPHNNWPYTIAINGPYDWTFPIFVVDSVNDPANCVMQKVGLYCNASPPWLYTDAMTNGLVTILANVPMPIKANCPRITGSGDTQDIWSGAYGKDDSFIVLDKGTKAMYECWELTDRPPASIAAALPGVHYFCQWAGYISNVETFSGVFPYRWGIHAPSLGAAGGMITAQDIRNVFNGGDIEHALAVGVPQTGGTFVPPATRCDGWGASPYIVPEGTRIQLVQALSGTTHPMAIAIAKALTKYGLVCVDTSGAVGFCMEDMRTLGSPYHIQGASAVDPFSLDWAGRWGAVNGPFWSNRNVAGDTSIFVNDLAPLWTGSEFKVLTPVSS